MKASLKKLLHHIKDEYKLIAPVGNDRGLFLTPITELAEIKLTSKLSQNTFKDFLFPQRQTLFKYDKEKLIEPAEADLPKLALFGIQTIDLRALVLYNQVFRKDAYYQAVKNRSLIIGYLKVASQNQTFGIFREKLEEDTLEHLEFDIFVLESPSGVHFFSGSRKGRHTLTNAGIKDFENIEFVGPIKESGLDPQMLKNYKLVKNSFNRHSAVWEELGRRCIACGKCALVCPTCFCFSTQYESGQKKNTGQRVRSWETCFYSDFSKVAGDHKFLNTIAKRIYFWYEHKFVRIPDEYSIPGCVGCGRCIEVCPVAIDLRKTLASLEKKPTKKITKKKPSQSIKKK